MSNVTRLNWNSEIAGKIEGLERQFAGNDPQHQVTALSNSQIVWTTPADGLAEDMPSLRAYTGQSQEEIKNNGWLKAIHPDDHAPAFKTWQMALTSGEEYQIEYRIRRFDGIYRSFLVRGAPVFDADGEIREWVGVCTDITTYKLAQQKLDMQYAVMQTLAFSEDLYKATPHILAAVGESMGWQIGAAWFWDKNKKVLYCRDIWHAEKVQAEEFELVTFKTDLPSGVGLPGNVWKTEKISKSSDIILEMNFPRHDAAIKSGLHGALAFPIRGEHKIHGVLEFYSFEKQTPDLELIQALNIIGSQVGLFIDKELSEKAASRISTRHQAILDASLDCIITINSKSEIIEFNHAAEQTFGYNAGDVLGKSIADLIIPPQYREHHLKGMEHYLATGEGKFIGERIEITAMRADGSEFPVELTITRIPVEGRPVFMAFLRDISGEKTLEEERTYLLLSETKLRDEAEKTSKYLENLQKVTDIVLAHASLQTLQDELLKRVTEVFHADSSAILLITPDQKELVVSAAIGLDALAANEVHVPLGQGVAGAIAKIGHPVIITDVHKTTLVNRYLGEQIRSLIGAPLFVEGRIIGVIHIGTIDERNFTPKDLDLLQRVADRVAVAIDHARLYHETTEQAGKLNAIINAMTDGVVFADKDGKVTLMNQAVIQRIGIDDDNADEYYDLDHLERVDRLKMRYVDGKEIPRDKLPLERVLAGEETVSRHAQEFVVESLQGETRFVSTTTAPVRDNKGEVIGAVLVSRDITERKELEHKAKESARQAQERADQLEAVFEAVTDAILVYDDNGKIIKSNEAAQKLLGFSADPQFETLSARERGVNWLIYDENGNQIPEQEMPIHSILVGTVYTEEDTRELLLQTRDKREIYLSMSGAPIRNEKGEITGAITISRDVTAHRQLEQRTRDALQALIDVAELLVSGTEEHVFAKSVQKRGNPIAHELAELTCKVLGCDRVGTLSVDPVTESIKPIAVFGLSPEDTERWWTSQEGQDVHLRDAPSAAAEVEKLLAGEAIIIDMTKPPYDKAPNPYNVKTCLYVPMRVKGKLIGLIALDHFGVAHEFTEEEISLADAIAKLTAMFVERDKLLQEREVARAGEIALLEANRRMDEFLGIASHELKTPLTSIKANIQLSDRRLVRLLSKLDKKNADLIEAFTPLRGLLESADRQSARLTRLINDLLDVSRIQSGHFHLSLELCNFFDILKEVVYLQRLSWPSRIILLDEMPNEQIILNIDTDRVGQVLTNFLTNALKYSPDGAPVEIGVHREDQYIQVSVTDHGSGLSKEDQQHIWERFYRVHDADQKDQAYIAQASTAGLGLGLYICRSIITQHGGEVGVESKEDIGSTFWFRLPLSPTYPFSGGK